MASGSFTTLTNQHLIQDDVWSAQIKQNLLDDLYAMRWVRMITDFPAGNTLHIPSIGEAETQDFSEGQAIKYNRFDTGDYTFEIDQYKYSANSISEKFKRDSMYAQEVLSSFVPKQHRALMEVVETRILSRPNAGQTASDLNTINGAAHRFVASGSNETFALRDLARVRYALKKANVPMTNLVGVVDPSVAYAIETQANVTNLLSPQSNWSDTLVNGLTTGYQYRFNLFGFDIFESNYLPSGLSETVDSLTVSTGVANMFFSAAPGDTLPIVGAFRQMPTVQSEFNKDLQQTECLTITEYGFDFYRPENMIIILTDTDQVS